MVAIKLLFSEPKASQSCYGILFSILFCVYCEYSILMCFGQLNYKELRLNFDNIIDRQKAKKCIFDSHSSHIVDKNIRLNKQKNVLGRRLYKFQFIVYKLKENGEVIP